MADKLIDPKDLGRPLPTWRWLVWYAPTFSVQPLVNPEYLVGGSDDLEEAERMADGRPSMSVRENPVWRTLN